MMLAELHVRNLGVIDDLHLVLGPGMTALTGETGAGKTLVVEAIELLLGGRADPVLVRPGADEALVEGRFVAAADEGSPATGEAEETVLARVVPRSGRSRAYVDGRLATVADLGARGRALVDLHGQHASQSLLSARAQRAALDRFGAVDLGPVAAARSDLATVDAALAALGGDARARARELDLLRFQVGEIDAAGLEGADEDEHLEAEEDLLAGAEGHRAAGEAALDELTTDGGALDGLGRAIAACAGHRPLADAEDRLRAAAADLAEGAADLRAVTEAIDVDPERLAAVQDRRRLLRELRRKYGEVLSEVLAYGEQARGRVAELEGHDARVAQLEAERTAMAERVASAAAAVGRARRVAAPRLASAVEGHLRRLAMPRARVEVSVGPEDPGDDVAILLGANAGEATLPLAKVASGGELARACLALRLVLTPGAAEQDLGPGRAGGDQTSRRRVPPGAGRGGAAGQGVAPGTAGGGTDPDAAGNGAPAALVFDEVDAGVGGQAAGAVGRALADLAAGGYQVLVVTHLPQVAAFADHQVAVTKEEWGGRTVARAAVVSGQDRVVELSRMLSGQPASATAQGHAEELLATASRERPR
ncbi:MAG: DNA repair protein RecN [Acidimicrobiales bacterium]